MGRAWIGISGFDYPKWYPKYYPEDLPKKRVLAYASRRFNSIELNGTFYSTKRPENFKAWHDETPEGFLFSVKGSRYISHVRRLRECETPLANFFASGLLVLAEKLGPIFWQLPPNATFDADALERFLAALPRDTEAAASLARRHDSWLEGRAHCETDANRPLRYGLEVRDESFVTDEVFSILRRHEVALVVADAAGRFPLVEQVTAPFVYVRLHGPKILYVSGYDAAALEGWAAKMERWLARGDVYAYFDNDAKVKAPFDAERLARRLGLTWREEHEAELAALTSGARARRPPRAARREPSPPPARDGGGSPRPQGSERTQRPSRAAGRRGSSRHRR